jgi:hypothetical protein
MVYKLSEFFVEVYYTCDELISSRIQIFLSILEDGVTPQSYRRLRPE